MPSENNRPLSPHLWIYRPQISTVLSIMHRFTGLVLTAGAVLVALWLWSAAYNTELYDQLQICLSSPLGQTALIGWTFAFYYHLGNGIRHLFWDAGHGFSLPVMHFTGWLVILFTLSATAGTWYCIYTRVTA